MRLSWWVPLATLLSLATAQPQGLWERTKSTVVTLMRAPFLSSQSHTALDMHDTLASLGTVTHAKDVGAMQVEERHVPEHRGPNIETGGTGGALEAMVAALSAGSEVPPPTEEPDASQPAPAPDNQQEGQQQQGGEEAAGGVAAEGAVAERDTVPSPAAEGQGGDPTPVEPTEGVPAEKETPTDATTQEEPAIQAPPPSPTNNGQEKAVEKYNEMSEQVVDILIQTIEKVDPLPIELSEEALTALEDLQSEPEPESEPETVPEPTVDKPKRRKNKNRNKNRRNKNKRGESTRDVEPEEEEEGVEGVEEGEENNNNKKVKNNKRGDEEDSETEAEGEKKGNKNKKNKRKNKKNKRGGGNDDSEDEGNSRRNKNKRKKNKNKQNRGDEDTKRRNKNRRKNNKNNNNNNKRTSKIEEVEIERLGKAMTDLQEEGEEAVQEQGRRVKNKNNNNNNKKNNKRKNNKNKKNKRKNQKGRTDLIEEAVAESGPVYPTQEERDTSNAILTGLTRISRQGDVTLDRNGNRDLVTLHTVVGPLKVQLSQMGRALTKAEVTAELNADITFKIRTKGRRMQVIKVRDVSVGELTSANINVARSDLVLEDDVINEAKNQVLSAVDVARVGRIINSELEAIFSVDDIVQNLPHHSLLQQQTQQHQQ